MLLHHQRQLNLELSSFLSDLFHTFENRLLPNDVILLRNIGEGHDKDITPSYTSQGEEETGVSLLGMVNQICVLVGNQRSCGAKIAGFDLSI